MRALVVGGTGLIGGAVAAALEERGHEVLRAGLGEGDVPIDFDDPASIRDAYEECGALDAVVSAAGIAVFGPLEELDDEAFMKSFANKTMGQINLVRFGLGTVKEGGSFTLTTGTLSQRPTPGTPAVAMAGGAVESFVRAAALDVEGRYRVNAISPAWVAESRVDAGLDPLPGIWAKELAAYYVRCIEGDENGAVLEAEEPLES